MNILYVTDLHGCLWKYEALLPLAVHHKADVVINGGDLYPKEGRNLFDQEKFITGYFNQHLRAFDKAGIYYLSQPGNDDLKCFDDTFAEVCARYSHARDIAMKVSSIGECEFIGFNLVPDYPFRLKDRCRLDTETFTPPRQLGAALLSSKRGWDNTGTSWSQFIHTIPTIEDELARLPKPVGNAAVYVIHCPPEGMRLDVCEDYRTVGSRAVAEFIAKQQPMLTLHGHIHESPRVTGGVWKVESGRTLCIQPGQSYFDDMAYVTLSINNGIVGQPLRHQTTKQSLALD